MDDFSLWWYIIAAVIYFFTRGKKKKGKQTSRPGTDNKPPQGPPKSFEDLLREITEGRQEEQPTFEQEPVVISMQTEQSKKKEPPEESRAFADDESKRVYEESIKMAENTDLKFEPAENFEQPRLFKGDTSSDKQEPTIADEIRNGLSGNEAKKAIIYSEILNRKY